MTQETNTKPQTPKLKPDFSHRAPMFFDSNDPSSLCDTVCEYSNRAKSILRLLESEPVMANLTDNKVDMLAVIESVIREINDIEEIVAAYWRLSDKSA